MSERKRERDREREREETGRNGEKLCDAADRTGEKAVVKGGFRWLVGT
jgi:hypothetical protein